MKNLHFNLLLLIAGIVFVGLSTSCNDASYKSSPNDAEKPVESKEKITYDTNSPRSMLLAMQEACGGVNRLRSLHDVEYDYEYASPDGKKDISKERYIFNNEISWANYTVHEINVSPELEGNIVQYYDGKNAFVYNNGKPLDDPAIVGTGQFLRMANYMWFNMMFKLTDPGIIYKYEGQEELDGTSFDVVYVTYDPEVTGKEQNDIFILYMNPKSHMVERFKFSLPTFGVMDPVLHAQLTYTEIDGIQIITRRIMTSPSPDGTKMVPMVDQQVSNVKFNNGFTAEQLSKEI